MHSHTHTCMHTCTQLLEFFSQVSEKTDEINENIFQNEEPDDLNDIEVTEEEIIKAIDDLEENSAAGPDGVPAILLKKVKEALALPLSLMLRKSIDEGKNTRYTQISICDTDP